MSALAPNNRWSTVRRLFEVAVDLPKEQRSAFLDVNCGQDDGTRQEVLALLAADESAMDLPVDRVPLAHGAEEAPVETRMPEILGFHLHRRLGAGGSSRVYEATCLENGARVALKVINTGANRQALQRFRQESRVLSRLDHPGIVGLHESGHTQDGHVYLAMDFIEGECIDRWCELNAPSTAKCVELMLQVMDALSHAHAAGVVHRDIKPQNILVDGNGRVRLVDFGVARLSREDGHRTGFHTETGNIVGTFAYMSPEQADGKSTRIGPATDIYQCALVLFKLLTGRLPYDVEDRGPMALLKAVLFERRMSLSEVRPELSGPLEPLIHGALDADPTKRPQTAQEFALQLKDALQALA